jgi:hypothetical protein
LSSLPIHSHSPVPPHSSAHSCPFPILCPIPFLFSLQDMLQYRKKLRPLRVRTLDSSIKTLLVDDSQTVAELTRTVCARIGEWVWLGVWSPGGE